VPTNQRSVSKATYLHNYAAQTGSDVSATFYGDLCD